MSVKYSDVGTPERSQIHTYLLLSSMMTSCSGLATAELSKTLRASVSEIDSDSAAEGEEEDAAAALNELEESGEEGGVETRCFTANSRFIACRQKQRWS